MRSLLLSGLALGLASPALASIAADARVLTGTVGGATIEVRSMLVGQTSTFAFPGNYAPARPGKDGVVFLETNAGFCSGSLMAGRTAILTAAHCVTDESGNIVVTSGRAWFWNGVGPVPDPFYDLQPGPTSVNIGAIHVAPGYTGQVIDHNDVAIIFLAGAAPAFAVEYLLADLTEPAGTLFNVAGFGNRGTSGNVGASGGTFGKLREGDNRFDFRLGDADFDNRWNSLFSAAFGVTFTNINHSWVSDFDNGLAANDASCRIGTHPVFAGLALGGAKYCNTGVGLREVGVAGGDSGGPQFDSLGRIVSVTSYGMTFGTAFGDIRAGLQSSFGEFSGYAPVGRQRAWIERLVPGAFVPEPGTWAMLIAGFGLVGTMARRRREGIAAA